MRYGNQLVQTTVISPTSRLRNMDDVMALIKQFSVDYGNRFGKGSEAPEAGIRINTVRVSSYVELETVQFKISRHAGERNDASPLERRQCFFVEEGSRGDRFLRHLATTAGCNRSAVSDITGHYLSRRTGLAA